MVLGILLHFKTFANMRIKSLPTSHHVLISQVVCPLILILLTPATNAMSERGASAMWWIKTYLRTTTTQSQLNHTMLLHIHEHLTDSISHTAMLNEFVLAITREASCTLENFDIASYTTWFLVYLNFIVIISLYNLC